MFGILVNGIIFFKLLKIFSVDIFLFTVTNTNHLFFMIILFNPTLSFASLAPVSKIFAGFEFKQAIISDPSFMAILF